MGDTTIVAVLGLGEAGSFIATELLAAGAVVRTYSPSMRSLEGAISVASEAEAVIGADVVLSVNAADVAAGAFRAALPGMRSNDLWADLNTASPEAKLELALMAEGSGVSFVDVALMGAVPQLGMSVPMLASGSGAARYATLMRPFGMNVEVLAGPAGSAATRKLLRSAFFKNVAASITESLEAAREAGCEDWLREQIVAEFSKVDSTAVDRIVSRTSRHARRRCAEMRIVARMLTGLGVEPTITEASSRLHERLSSPGPATAKR